MAEFNQFRLGDAIGAGQDLAFNNYRLGEAARGIQARSGLTNALQAGTPEAMNQYSQQFPQEAADYKKQTAASRKDEIENKLFEFSVIEKLMSGVNDENTYQQARKMMSDAGMDISRTPQNYDPAYIQQQMKQALGIKGQLEMEQRELEKSFKERQLRVEERKAAAAERESSGRGKPPPHYQWSADGKSLEPIPGGAATKPTEAQQKQLTGVINLQNAVDEYLKHLDTWGTTDIISPDARARMGTKYNNMMLQAKEAYNLGVLNGPDFEILQRVVTDPRSLTGAITSNQALGDQAKELKRIMGSIGQTAATGQVRNMPGQQGSASSGGGVQAGARKSIGGKNYVKIDGQWYEE